MIKATFSNYCESFKVIRDELKIQPEVNLTSLLVSLKGSEQVHFEYLCLKCDLYKLAYYLINKYFISCYLMGSDEAWQNWILYGLWSWPFFFNPVVSKSKEIQIQIFTYIPFSFIPFIYPVSHFLRIKSISPKYQCKTLPLPLHASSSSYFWKFLCLYS